VPQYQTPLLKTHCPGVLFWDDDPEPELHEAMMTMPTRTSGQASNRFVTISP
jgi:hypothetical protein